MAKLDRPDGWTIKQELRMLRAQMLVHSHIYYELDDSLITDHEWQARADRLTKLQAKVAAKYGHCKIGFFDDAFQAWDGSSGYHLPLRDPWVVAKAAKLLRMRDENRSGV